MTKYPVTLIFIENHLKQQKNPIIPKFSYEMMMESWQAGDNHSGFSLYNFESMLIIEKKNTNYFREDSDCRSMKYRA